MGTDALINALYIVILLLASVFAIYVFKTLSLKEKIRLNDNELRRLEKTMEELRREINELKQEIISLRQELSGEP
ncbi:MAG: hypothetical protein F7C33_05310 [Desulfurococcales archaeon]|nr:hypothetical protein [Desulfurococcales archaeon]